MINDQERQLNSNPARDTDDRFFFNIHKMELERVKFILKSYLRTRLFKIEKHVLYIVEKEMGDLLSEGEIAYAFNVYENKKQYFDNVMLSKLPEPCNPFRGE